MEHFLKKVYFCHWKFQKIAKIINLLLGMQIFVSTDARFDHKACKNCLNPCNFWYKMHNFGLCQLIMCYQAKGDMKKISMSKIDFLGHLEHKKWRSGKWPLLTNPPSPPKVENSTYFFNPSLKMNLFLIKCKGRPQLKKSLKFQLLAVNF